MDLTDAFEAWRLSGDKLTELIRETAANLEKREFEVQHTERLLAESVQSVVESQLDAIREQAYKDVTIAVKDVFIQTIKTKRQVFDEQSFIYKLLTQLINDLSRQ
ncbi:MAG: hypothetical protein ACK5R2_12985 [Cyanobacteriota bacterium]|jgi:hypothetical protein